MYMISYVSSTISYVEPYDIVEPLFTILYMIFHTVSAYRISYAIFYYDIVDSELLYGSLRSIIGYHMHTTS